MGPVFACIIGEQFRRLKYGDRFFYTHTPDVRGGRGLGKVARNYVLQRTLGDLICDNTALQVMIMMKMMMMMMTTLLSRELRSG